MISNAANLWERRDLLGQLTLAELRSSTSDSHLGWLWWLLDPLLTMLIYWAIVVGIFGRGEQYDPYPLFILCALLPFRHLSSTLNAAATSLRMREGLIRAIPFPTMVIPLAIASSRFGFFLFGTLVLIGAALMWGRPLGPALIQLPFLFVCQLFLVAGLALLVSAFGALVSDLSDLLTHVTRVLFYACPTIYGIDMARQALGASSPAMQVYLANPFVILFTGYRDSVFHGRFSEPEPLMGLAAGSVACFLMGFGVFRYFDRRVIKFL